MHYLGGADHKDEVLESYVTRKREKSLALRFFRKALKRHGQPEVIVPKGCDPTLQRCGNSAIWIDRKWGGT